MGIGYGRKLYNVVKLICYGQDRGLGLLRIIGDTKSQILTVVKIFSILHFILFTLMLL